MKKITLSIFALFLIMVVQAITVTVNITTANTTSTVIPAAGDVTLIDKLIVTGTIDARDMVYIRGLAELTELDLAGVTFSEWNGTGGTQGNGTIPTLYSANQFPNSGMYGHRKLKKVIFPTTITSFGNYALGNCTAIESAVIPASVTNLGTGLFSGCTGLKTVELQTIEAPAAGWDVFGNDNAPTKSNATLIVPAGSIQNYTSWQFTSSTIVEKTTTPITYGGTIFTSNFNLSNPWTEMTAQSSVTGIQANASWTTVGTIDVANTSTASGALLLAVNTGGSTEMWTATLSSGYIAINNTETNLGKLTLSFDHSVSEMRPVYVQIESFDANKSRTGGLEGQVEPAATDFFIRSALELSTMKPLGGGTFVPTDPFVRISFKIMARPSYLLPGYANKQLRIDNIAYSSPAFYVKPTGSNNNDGKTEATALQTAQKALDLAQAGDIICLMEGTYNTGTSTFGSFQRAGTPAAWIVLKNYPGHKPKIVCNGWNTIHIGKGSKSSYYTGPALAYLEIRGLHLRGEGDIIKNKWPETIGKADGRSNTNGIATEGRYMNNEPHHIRIADNLVEYMPAAGIGTGETDWVIIENNIVRNNCWTNIYACSGISNLGASNFDTSSNVYKILIRNNVSYRNENFQMWMSLNPPRISDGNGIILDVNRNTGDRPNEVYIGRTLVQGNLCFDNGGSGIHTVQADHVDIINNTAYLNSASTALTYSQMYSYGSKDVNFINNIMVAPVANTAAGELPEPVNKLGGVCSDITFANNIYFGGNITPTFGYNDRIADPKFVNATIDPLVADFRLQSTSPAINGGSVLYDFLPWTDPKGYERRAGGKMPDIGAFEYRLSTGFTDIRKAKSDFAIFPNPVSDYLTIVSNSDQKIRTIELFTASGTKLFSETITQSNEYRLHTRKFKPGIYLLKINDGANTVFEKIIKK